ncbi:MAG: hypothetical protein RhofKO_42550 [Rhodothermales bacterium]
MSSTIYILGINAYHGNASAALVADEHLVAAIEEDRFNRVKHWAGFPAESIRYCLDVAGVQPEEVDHIAISFDPRASMRRRLAFVARNQPSVTSLMDRLKRQGKTLKLCPYTTLSSCQGGMGIPERYVR